MNQIKVADTNQEKAMASLLKKNTLESPSLNFTARVMAEVEKASIKIADEPIISKKVWTFISIFIGSIFIYALLTGEKNTSSSTAFNEIIKKWDQLLTSSLSFELPEIIISPLFGLSIFALSSLLFLDYYLKNRKISMTI